MDSENLARIIWDRISELQRLYKNEEDGKLREMLWGRIDALQWVSELLESESFEAPRMRGTDFSIDGIEDWPLRTYEDERSREEILEMIEQIRDRLEYYKLKYKEAKAAKDRSKMVSSIRNWKALEGARQALRWALGEEGVDHPLY